MSFNISSSFEFILLTRQKPLATFKRNGRIDVIVYPSWYKQVAVEWAVPPSFGRCLFNVYFSPVEDGSFHRLNPTPIDGTYLMDPSTMEFSKNNHGFYVVEALLQDHGGIALRSDPTTWNTHQRRWVELRSIEIQRREYWLLSRFAGIKSYLFRRRSYGERCRVCWDPKLEKVMDDHCPTCLGTSFEGGYFNPAPLYLQYDATPNALVKTYFGNYEPNQMGAWTISMPLIRPDDVIVRTGDWNAYKVDRLTPTELQGNPVRQMMVLNQLAKSDVEYQLISRNLPDFPVEFAPDYKV